MERKLQLFLRERDRARERGDAGVYRSLTADLRRWGIPDDATLANPSGRNGKAAATEAPVKRGPGRPPKPKCEHGNPPDRCEDCAAEELEDAKA